MTYVIIGGLGIKLFYKNKEYNFHARDVTNKVQRYVISLEVKKYILIANKK